jgi:hypothetical protein
MGASARRLCPISSPSPSCVIFGSSRKQCVCQQVAGRIQFAPISLFPALSAQQAGRAHRRMFVPPRRDGLPLRNVSSSSGFSRTLKNSRWRSTCGWNAAHKDDQTATGSKSYMDLEMEIFQFMENSSSPDTFPSKDDLIQAGRADLVNAIQLQGGWLAIGWDDAEDETLLTSSEFLATEFSSPGNTPALNTFVEGNSYNWPSKSLSVIPSSYANGLALGDDTADVSNSQDICRPPTTTEESNSLEDEGFAAARPLAGLKGVDFSRGRRGSAAVDSMQKSPAQTNSTVLSQLDDVINNLLKSLGLGFDARADSVDKSRTDAHERENVEKGSFDAWDDLGLGESKQDLVLADGKQESGSGEDKQENGFGEGELEMADGTHTDIASPDKTPKADPLSSRKQDLGLANSKPESGSDEDNQENGFREGKLETAGGSHTDIASPDETPKADPLSSRKQDLGLADGKQESGSDEDKQDNGFGGGKLELADSSHTDIPSPDETSEADPLSSSSSLAEERDHSSGESSSAPSEHQDVAAEELSGDLTSGETVAPLQDDRTDEESVSGEDSPMEDPTQPGLETDTLRRSSGAEINAGSSPEFSAGDERAGEGAEGGAEDEAEAAASPGDGVPPESETGGSDSSPQAEAAASPGDGVPLESEPGGSDASPQEQGPSRASPEAGGSGSMSPRKR